MPKHLSEQQFNTIKTLARMGVTQKVIARDHVNVSAGTVSKAVNAKDWNDFKGIAPKKPSGQAPLFVDDQVIAMLEDITGMLHQILERMGA